MFISIMVSSDQDDNRETIWTKEGIEFFIIWTGLGLTTNNILGLSSSTNIRLEIWNPREEHNIYGVEDIRCRWR